MGLFTLSNIGFLRHKHDASPKKNLDQAIDSDCMEILWKDRFTALNKKFIGHPKCKRTKTSFLIFCLMFLPEFYMDPGLFGAALEWARSNEWVIQRDYDWH